MYSLCFSSDKCHLLVFLSFFGHSHKPVFEVNYGYQKLRHHSYCWIFRIQCRFPFRLFSPFLLGSLRGINKTLILAIFTREIKLLKPPRISKCAIVYNKTTERTPSQKGKKTYHRRCFCIIEHFTLYGFLCKKDHLHPFGSVYLSLPLIGPWLLR